MLIFSPLADRVFLWYNNMKIKIKNMDFREKRLIFQEAPKGVPGAAPAGDAAGGTAASGEIPKNYYDAATYTYYDEAGNPSSMSPEEAAARGISTVQQTPDEEAPPAATERTEVTDKTKAELVRLDTVTNLSALREKMGDDFNKVVEVLRDKKMAGEIKVDQLAEGFLFLGGEEAFQRAVKEQLSPADMDVLKDALGKFYTFTDAEFPTFLPKVAAVATMGIFQSTIQEKYPHILTFDKFKDGHIPIKYDLSFDGENPALNLSLPSGVQPLYEQHAAAEQKKVEEAGQQQQAAATQKAEAEKLATDREAFRDQLRQNPIGAFLVDFFDGPGPDGKPGLIDKLFEGKSPILAFLLGALGVGKFKGSYDNIRRMADKNPKLKGLLDQVEERVKPYRVDTPAAATATEGPKFPQMNKGKFAEVVERHEVPETGVQLSEDYLVATGKKLKVDLRAGSLILPAGKSLNVDGKSTPEAAVGGNAREFKDTELVLVKAIPEGTIFHKGVKLELV